MTDVYPRYVAGLLFNDLGSSVALIRKIKPEWQRGKLNAIGGKIEKGETPLQAMHREFAEEAGVEGVVWCPLEVNTFKSGAVVHFYYAFDTDAMNNLDSLTEEVVHIYDVQDVMARAIDTIHNIPYLIEKAKCFKKLTPEFTPL